MAAPKTALTKARTTAKAESRMRSGRAVGSLRYICATCGRRRSVLPGAVHRPCRRHGRLKSAKILVIVQDGPTPARFLVNGGPNCRDPGVCGAGLFAGGP